MELRRDATDLCQIAIGLAEFFGAAFNREK